MKQLLESIWNMPARQAAYLLVIVAAFIFLLFIVWYRHIAGETNRRLREMNRRRRVLRKAARR